MRPLPEKLRPQTSATAHGHDFLSAVARVFLESNFSLILIVVAVLIGLAAILITPREEDPQIVVPLADVYVNLPGKSALEVERLVAGRLEKLLYQIDGVEYVYSMSSAGRAIITVRFYVGQDRERSLVKLFTKINENVDIIPPGVTGWVVKPVEIDDVPIVTLRASRRRASREARTTMRCGASARNWSSGLRRFQGYRGRMSWAANRESFASSSIRIGCRATLCRRWRSSGLCPRRQRDASRGGIQPRRRGLYGRGGACGR